MLCNMLNNENAEHVFYALCVIDFTRTLTFIDFQGIVYKYHKKEVHGKNRKSDFSIVFTVINKCFRSHSHQQVHRIHVCF